MGLGRRIGDTLRLPGPGARRSVAVLAVFALAGAAGSAVALSSPALVERLGLVQEAAAPAPPVPQAVLRPLAVEAPTPTPAGLADVLDPAADDMPGRFAGVVIDPATGAQLWGHTPERAFVPASTGKVLTAAAALLTLNPTDRLDTRVVAGSEPGTVVLVGGGDPTLTALPEGEESLYPDAPRISELADEVRENAQGEIDTVLVDTSRYTGPRLAEGWLPGDIAAGYITPIEPLMVDGGRVDPTLQDGPRVEDPALAAGRALAEELGVESVDEGTADPGAVGLASVSSAPIAELVEHSLRVSDNTLADMLAHEVALARDDEGSFAGGARQVLAALEQAGIDTTGAHLVDASGMSTRNEVPPQLLGAVLAAAAAPAQNPLDTQFLRPILSGLPVAGGEGTLDDRYARSGDAASGRGVVRAKTGSLTGVSSLAGVVTDADGRLLVFALMSNGANPGEVRPLHDAMAADLSRCGCAGSG
ncbi:D-alanyl-D-alanine carboxypeptidase/D-alanyl-D-alanine endopeptidase [Pseudonocardia kunmingensis]|uniref:D-alanyl-D-alanine carboxypeptidase/D-alanyl-D-alanine-endopeptidase (Penicillin-binding protein 4) n=1 Tax=Pseudonocardia kunmingensis TaxID=630975 RepID=A0A543E2K3_9PSEU|nr:D-alanyl-D-alanine carboxypeptidase/D-alanyl-D-alanine-endopeptidase [Pseudonocardia kunmingensis]TQM15831.1 D-alanyl-D-alanine carboxypeptidase/D-alanyl-D-alanine-endopeptidase (penicillin-binding protein 4) [Pseudonocardia kunmingensis]